MKTADQITPNLGPIYAAAMYPDLSKIAQQHGYALAVHGSLARDFDLIAVPWAESVSGEMELIQAFSAEFSIHVSPDSPASRNHGRIAYTLIIGFGDCQIDLSFIRENDRPR